MSEEQEARYKVTFLGPARNDITNVNKLAEGLKDRFKLSDEAVTKVMRMAPVVIKKDATLAEAQQYKGALEAIGARVQLEPIEEAREELQLTQEGASSLDREPQIIPVRAKTPLSSEMGAIEGETEAQTITCPQCGCVQDMTDECTRCGIIISNFLKYQEEVKPAGVEGVSPGAADGTPAEGPQPRRIIGTPIEAPTDSTPWEDMASLGFVTAFFRTMKEVLFSPTAFFRNMPVSKGMGSPLLYGIIISFFAMTVGLLGQYAISGFIGSFSQVEGMQGVNFFQTVFLLMYAFIFPIMIAISLFIGSAIFHICLIIVGTGKRGFEATFRVVSYTSSSAVFWLIPFVGWIIVFIYNLVLWTIGFRETHRTTTGRAFIAVLLPMIIMSFFIGLLVFAIIIPLIFSQGQPMMEQPPQSF
ncbi:MAG: YIP1 family protein [Desulfobacterales bacterium]|nr:YIP1 family protein [Desulfobacterales bacterium]